MPSKKLIVSLAVIAVFILTYGCSAQKENTAQRNNRVKDTIIANSPNTVVTIPGRDSSNLQQGKENTTSSTKKDSAAVRQGKENDLANGKKNIVPRTVNASILLPLYLDSLYKPSGYAYSNSIPRFAMPALEFYNGVQLAIDSLNQEGIKARIEIVDSKKGTALSLLFNQYSFYKPDLLIGVVQSSSELKRVADMALQNQVPFISATYPNDAGISANPDLLIANSTLKTHCYGIYNYVQAKHANENIVMFYRKSAPAGDRIKQYITEADASSNGKKLNWKVVPLSDSFSVAQVGYYLDSLQSNAVIGASLNDDFSIRLIKALSALKGSYKSSVFGMPTWDEYTLTKPEFRGVDVYFSTPFVSYTANARLFNSITDKFTKAQNSKPSDMVFKGFEITYRYVKTLAQNPDNFLDHVNDGRYRLFADFRFEPVKSGSEELPDYWENKKLYFVKKTDGLVKAVY